jgi:NAD(P)-dependent dehydrogenase (short-subunit alcohol dehydrogenase family)
MGVDGGTPVMKALRAVVTGGATNIGRAITESFLAQGGRVVVGQPDPAVAASLVERYGDRVIPLCVDVGDPGQCVRFVNEAAKMLGGLDVLVNNAAITGVPAIASLEKLTAADFSRLVGVNLGGVIFCSQAAVPHLRAAGGGTIIHISSVNAIRPQRGAMLYAATKAAVSSLAQSMGKELAPDRIRVVAVAPGDIRVDTSIQQHAELAARGAVSDVVNQTPLGPGTPEDIAETVAFLCSDRARFVTGTTWVVDGGLLA